MIDFIIGVILGILIGTTFRSSARREQAELEALEETEVIVRRI